MLVEFRFSLSLSLSVARAHTYKSKLLSNLLTTLQLASSLTLALQDIFSVSIGKQNHESLCFIQFVEISLFKICLFFIHVNQWVDCKVVMLAVKTSLY